MKKKKIPLKCILGFLKNNRIVWSLHNIMKMQEEKCRGAGRNGLLSI